MRPGRNVRGGPDLSYRAGKSWVKRRRAGGRWLLVALALAAIAHGGSGALLWWLAPPLPARLHLRLLGEGSGVVVSQPQGIFCGQDCVEDFPPGTEVELVALIGEGSTFEVTLPAMS